MNTLRSFVQESSSLFVYRFVEVDIAFAQYVQYQISIIFLESI